MKRSLLVILMLAGACGVLPFASAQLPARKPGTASSKAAATKKKAAAPVRRVPPVDPTLGDNVDGEDLTVRRAAVEALGTQNGSVVVVDPSNGRVLSIVNQKLALAGGFTPCSTIKLVTALAALSEQVVSRYDVVHISRFVNFNLDDALAHSNNEYFGELGKRLGFDRVSRYAKMLGLGEPAGLDIPGEHAGGLPDGPPKAGGMILLTAYGEGFQVTPLQLAALVSAIANGGTLYYLQYPRSGAELEHYTPKVKHPLELASTGIDHIKNGMRGAVDHGTGRLANYDPAEQLYGKTGTCTDFRAGEHMGWFGSFLDSGPQRLVVVVMLANSYRNVSGPGASAVAGAVYKSLASQHYSIAQLKRNDLPEIITSSPTNTASATGH
jgi:cell division protein FtsI/penicillin-binding protein 2